MYRVLVDYTILGRLNTDYSERISGFNEANARFLQKVAEYSRLIAQVSGDNKCDIQLRDVSVEPFGLIQEFSAQAPDQVQRADLHG